MRRVIALTFVAVLFGIAPSAALAQVQPPASGEDRQAEARSKAEEGLAFFSAQQWNSAYRAFSEADALYSAPTLTLYRARCLRRVGKLLDAKSLYRKLANYHLDSAAPESFKKAQQDGEDELGSLIKRIPVLQVQVPLGAPTGARVTIDGTPVDASMLEHVEVDPGSHSIVAQAENYVALLKHIDVVEATTTPVELRLLPRLQQVPAVPVLPVSSPSAILDGPSIPTFSIAMFISASAGAAIGAFGCGFASKTDSPTAPAAIAGAGFGIGVTSLVAGIVFMNLPPRNSVMGRSRLMIGPGSLNFSGRF